MSQKKGFSFKGVTHVSESSALKIITGGVLSCLLCTWYKVLCCSVTTDRYCIIALYDVNSTCCYGYTWYTICVYNPTTRGTTTFLIFIELSPDKSGLSSLTATTATGAAPQSTLQVMYHVPVQNNAAVELMLRACKDRGKARAIRVSSSMYVTHNDLKYFHAQPRNSPTAHQPKHACG